MDDDFNTAGAIGEVFKAARAVSGAIARGGGLDRATLAGFVGAVRRIGAVLGLFGSEPGGLVRAACARSSRPALAADVDPAWVEGEDRRARRRPQGDGTSPPPTASAPSCSSGASRSRTAPGGRRGG